MKRLRYSKTHFYQYFFSFTITMKVSTYILLMVGFCQCIDEEKMSKVICSLSWFKEVDIFKGSLQKLPFKLIQNLFKVRFLCNKFWK